MHSDWGDDGGDDGGWGDDDAGFGVRTARVFGLTVTLARTPSATDVRRHSIWRPASVQHTRKRMYAQTLNSYVETHTYKNNCAHVINRMAAAMMS